MKDYEYYIVCNKKDGSEITHIWSVQKPEQLLLTVAQITYNVTYNVNIKQLSSITVKDCNHKVLFVVDVMI